MHWQGGAQASCLGAASRLDGLSLHVTLPYSEYGPGAPIKVMATFRNRGPGALALPFPVKAEAAVRAEGQTRTYVPKAEAGLAPLRDALRTVVLSPGESFAWSFTIQPGRRDLLPGDYPLVVCASFSPPPPDGGGAGARCVGGTLLSNEVVLRVRYKVLWVG